MWNGEDGAPFRLLQGVPPGVPTMGINLRDLDGKSLVRTVSRIPSKAALVYGGRARIVLPGRAQPRCLADLVPACLRQVKNIWMKSVGCCCTDNSIYCFISINVRSRHVIFRCKVLVHFLMFLKSNEFYRCCVKLMFHLESTIFVGILTQRFSRYQLCKFSIKNT